ncbi:hypothetical protein [Actinokineospora sp. HUAS TT18]|uniref:hypothetical protein n=1 Tax=Actinokineospora sp. HUAS TT18 TaxID=3447451 RepID=UPI003F5222E9
MIDRLLDRVSRRMVIMRGTMSIHAFIDESRRGSRYFVAAALVHPGHLRALRRELVALLIRGQREIHFHNEKEPRQRLLADTIARMPVQLSVYSRTCARKDEPARQDCIAELTRDLIKSNAQRLVIDSRSHRDTQDSATIRRVLISEVTGLTYEHMSSTGDPLLWIPDIAAWCYGAGGDWRKRIAPILSHERDLDIP